MARKFSGAKLGATPRRPLKQMTALMHARIVHEPDRTPGMKRAVEEPCSLVEEASSCRHPPVFWTSGSGGEGIRRKSSRRENRCLVPFSPATGNSVACDSGCWHTTQRRVAGARPPTAAGPVLCLWSSGVRKRKTVAGKYSQRFSQRPSSRRRGRHCVAVFLKRMKRGQGGRAIRLCVRAWSPGIRSACDGSGNGITRDETLGSWTWW